VPVPKPLGGALVLGESVICYFNGAHPCPCSLCSGAAALRLNHTGCAMSGVGRCVRACVYVCLRGGGR
jgi:hypothetical protein